jgi:hypothetical protein
VPGVRYSTRAPLLMYARLAVQRRGAQAHEVTWTVPEFPSVADQRAWVCAQVANVVDAAAATTETAPVVIGKSLASLAAPVVAARGLPAIWLTPLLTDGPTVTALREASLPSLLVGGTGDDFWDPGIASSITSHVLEVEGADHALLLPGPLAQSARVLGQVVSEVEEFLDNTVWA